MVWLTTIIGVVIFSGNTELAINLICGSLVWLLMGVGWVWLRSVKRPAATVVAATKAVPLFFWLAWGGLWLFIRNGHLSWLEGLALLFIGVVAWLGCDAGQAAQRTAGWRGYLGRLVGWLLGAVVTAGIVLLVGSSGAAWCHLPPVVWQSVVLAAVINFPLYRWVRAGQIKPLLTACLVLATVLWGLIGLVAGDLTLAPTLTQLTVPFVGVASLLAFLPVILPARWQPQKRWLWGVALWLLTGVYWFILSIG